MSEFDISYIGAAGAGMLSFLSPCVLPLVPAYLCFLGGVSLEELTDAEAAGTERAAVTGRVVLAALAFVIGFSVVFISFGATASALSQLILEYKLVLGKIAGVVIILFGLHFMGLFRLALLNREARFHPTRRPAGLIGAFLLGLAFAFGWTPCIGPVLATVLTVAAKADSVTYGSSLLTAYAAGLGVPFLLAAFLARPFMNLMRRFRRHMQKVEFVVGALLVVTGLLFIFNSFEILGFYLLEAFPFLAEIG
jgi:cytochrome c-type biogenesis protein